MESKDAFGLITAGIANVTYVAVTQSNLETLLNIAVLIVALLSGIISVIYTSVRWYRMVTDEKSDGGSKITAKEITNLVDEIEKELKNGNQNK